MYFVTFQFTTIRGLTSDTQD